MANENQWNFPPNMGPQPHTPRAYQQYTAGPYQHLPGNYHTPEAHRPPLQPMQTPPYTDPLQQMLPMPQSTPRATPRREDRAGVFAPGYFASEERELASEGEGPEDNEYFGRAARINIDHVTRVEGDRDARVELRVKDRAARVEPRVENAARIEPRVENDVAKPKGRDATAKTAKEKVKTAKKTGRGSRSGALNRRDVGASEDEIEGLSKKNVKEAAVKFKNEGWTDEKKLLVLNYITSEKVWTDWKINQAKEFLNVSSLVF